MSDQAEWEPTWRDYVVSAVGGICFLGQVLLCFIAYNYLGWNRVLYLGWTILAIAVVIGMSSRRTFEEHAGASAEEGGRDSQKIVASGMYGVVRHPIYLSFTLVILALMLISQHWLSPILGLPWMVYLYLSMLGEEQANIQRFGDAYRRYMQEVPRVNFIVGAIRHLRRRRKGAGVS
jgi:protein-S-isoprenylcysteine O-methyltransferase Ste14